MGPLSFLFQWWRHLSSVGPDFGYFSDASKTILIVKTEYLAPAESIFASANIQITVQGQRNLGAALGTCAFTEAYMSHRKWQLGPLKLLFWLVLPLPVPMQAACCSFTHGMIGRWMCVMRTIPDISPLFKPHEDAIYLKLLPSFTGHSVKVSYFLFLVAWTTWGMGKEATISYH